MDRPLVLYHARCPDGMASAWVTRTALMRGGPEPECVPMDYGSPVPLFASGRDVYMVDYCVPQSVLTAMADVCRSVTVIDHHKSNAKTVAVLSGTRPNLHFTFDEAHSGGFLCWRHFFPDAAPSPLVLYTEDRDLWTWSLPHSREVSAYLSTLPWGDFKAWNDANFLLQAEPPALTDRESRVVTYGRIILAFQERLIEDHLRAAFETEFDGHKVLAANCSCAPISSELTGRLAAGRAFGVSWFVRRDGKAQVSLRARGDTGIDCTAVTTKFGGGGHAAAAGFQVPAGRLPFATPRTQDGGAA